MRTVGVFLGRWGIHVLSRKKERKEGRNKSKKERKKGGRKERKKGMKEGRNRGKKIRKEERTSQLSP